MGPVSVWDRSQDYQDAYRVLESAQQRGVRLVIPELDASVIFKPCVFFSFSKIEEYFGVEGRIERLLNEIYANSQRSPSADTIAHGHLKVFCLLLIIGYPDLVHLFIDGGLNDETWPLTSNTKPDAFPHLNDEEEDRHLWETFRDKQWEFYPHIFKSAAHGIGVDFRYILPIASESRLGEGNHATTWRIDIHPGYHELDKSNNPQAETYVLKISNRDEPDAIEAYDSEKVAFQRLKDEHADVVKYLGSFHQKNVACILLEFADEGNLEDYFRKHSRPGSDADIVTFWKHFLKITKGLQDIHQHFMMTGHLGSHRDLKPQNILCFSQGRSSPYEYSFKIADLGLSHYLPSQSMGSQKLQACRVGNRTYGSPESRKLKTMDIWTLTVDQKSDVWSLACVIMVAACWVVGEMRKIEAFATFRYHERQNSGIASQHNDAFHDDQQVLRPIQQIWFPELEKQSMKDDRITEHIWHLVEPGLREEGRRLTAEQFRYHVLDYFKSELMIGLQENHAHTYPMPKVPGPVGTLRRASTIACGQSASECHRSVIGQPFTASPATNTAGEEIYADPGNRLDDFNYVLPNRESLINDASIGKAGHTPTTTSPRRKLHAEQPHLVIPDTTVSVPAQSRRNTPEDFKLAKCPKHEAHNAETMTVNQLVEWTQGRSETLPHSELLKKLRKRDHVIVVDNSISMKPLWEKVIHLVSGLAGILRQVDDDELELYWTNYGFKKCSTAESLIRKVSSLAHSCSSTTDPDDTFNDVFTEHKNSVLRGKRKLLRRKHKNGKPLSVYFLTDGEWQPRSDLKQHVERIVQFLNKNDKVEGRPYAIQLIQFGASDVGTQRMKELDEFRPQGRDLVDTEKYDGNVWKMLLGAINPSFDDEPPCTCGRDPG